MLGEIHGTREIPRFVAAVVEACARREEVVLGLETPRTEQAALDAYLASEGSSEARAALAATKFWGVQGDQHDGRRSHDMLDLIEHLRLRRQSGTRIDVLAYDIERPMPGRHHARDPAMAAFLRSAVQARPEARFLVLTGNVHAMRERPSYAPAEMQLPMGYQLRDLVPYSVHILARAGEYWGCRDGCRTWPVQTPPSAESGPSPDPTFHLQIVLPQFQVARLIGVAPAESTND